MRALRVMSRTEVEEHDRRVDEDFRKIQISPSAKQMIQSDPVPVMDAWDPHETGGRSPEHSSSNEKVVALIFWGLAIFLVILTVFGLGKLLIQIVSKLVIMIL